MIIFSIETLVSRLCKSTHTCGGHIYAVGHGMERAGFSCGPLIASEVRGSEERVKGSLELEMENNEDDCDCLCVS